MAAPIKRTPIGARPVQRDRLSPFQFAAEEGRNERMPYRRCGRSGLKLPAISLGAWETFGGYRGHEIARECIFRAFNLGITHFDLANNYGHPPGRAEMVVSRALREIPRDEIIVATKAGFPMWEGPYGQGASRKHILASIDQSLARLEMDYVDIFYSHRMDDDTPLEETLGALDSIVRSGKALYVGLCNYSGEKLRAALKVAAENGLAPLVIEQSVYNLLQREIEGDLLPACREAGLGVATFSPIAQGLLSTKYLEEIPADSRGATLWSEQHRARLTREFRRSLQNLVEIARGRGQTLPQMAIAWALRRPEVTTVIVGASEVAQVEENVKALEQLRFNEDELRQIDEALR